MKFTKICLTAIASLLLVTGCAKIGQGIISVNGEVITKSEYDQTFKEDSKSPQYALFAGDISNNPDGLFSLILRNQIVNKLVVKKLLAQEIAKEGVTASKEEIQNKEQEVIEQVGGVEAFKERLKQTGISESRLKKDLEEEIKIDKLVEKAGSLEVTDKEVETFYKENKDKFNHPDLVRASHILIEANPDKIKQDVISNDKKGLLNADQIDEKVTEAMKELKAKAEEIRAKAVSNPESFEQLARENSDDPGSKSKGGDLGFFPKGQMVPEFEAVAFSITPNQVSEIVETPFGYHIIIVTDRKKAGVDSLDDVREDIRAYLAKQKKVELLDKIFTGLKSNAKIEYLDENFNPDVIQKKVQEAVTAQQEKSEDSKK